MEIILDGNIIKSKEDLFVSLKKQINNKEFNGNNLDALWDILTSIKEPINITIKNIDLLKLKLLGYIDMLLTLFNDLKEINSEVTIQLS